MSLLLYRLYQIQVRAFSSVEGDSRFRADFVDAVNRCLDDLSKDANLETVIPHVDTFNDSIAQLDEVDSGMMVDGLTKFLVESGRDFQGGMEGYQLATRNWETGKAQFKTTQQLNTMETVDDDDIPTSDMIGLGYPPGNG